MSEYKIVYSTLRDELASAYWQAENARVVTLDVRIDPIHIHWAEKPRVYWNDILIRAINENKIRDLLERACSGKPDMERLKDQFLALYAGMDPAFMQAEDELLPFPLSRSYSGIVKELCNGTVVPVLGPGVNPRIYIDLAACLVKLLVKETFRTTRKSPTKGRKKNSSRPTMALLAQFAISFRHWCHRGVRCWRGFRKTWTARFSMSKCFRLPRPTVET